MKRPLIALFLVLSLLALTGCRSRTTAARTVTGSGMTAATESHDAGDDAGTAAADASSRSGTEDAESSPFTTENPASERREYDDQASAQVVPGAEHIIGETGEGSGEAHQQSESGAAADLLSEDAKRRATQSVPSENADRLGTDENADRADTFLIYYTVLLQERLGSLFECQKREAYLELPEDYRTVHKTSAEHQLILRSGCYDVSARLLEENLTVSDGWVQRKNPGVIVKLVSDSVLGFGIQDTGRAEGVYTALMNRPAWSSIDAVKQGRVVLLSEKLLASQHLQTFARLMIAQTAIPDLFADIDPEQALRELSQEAAGSPAEGILWYRKE